MKQTVRAGFPLLHGLVALVILAVIYLGQSLPLTRTLLEKNLTGKAQAIAGMAAPSVARAMESNDDISLLIQIESLSRTDDVSAAFVLDRSGSVLIHNKTAEWHKTYTDQVAQNAARSDKTLVQRTKDGKGYLYSVPVTSSSVLCILLSGQKADEIYSFAVKRAVLTGAAVLLLVVAFAALLARVAVVAPLKKLELSSYNITPGSNARLPVEAPDEIAALGTALNAMLDRFEGEHDTTQERCEQHKKRIRSLLEGLLESRKEAYIVTDAENMLVAMNSAAREFWGTAGVVGKHLLDIRELSDLVVLVQSADAAGNQGQAITRVLNGRTISAVVVLTPEKKVAGKIIMVVD